MRRYPAELMVLLSTVAAVAAAVCFLTGARLAAAIVLLVGGVPELLDAAAARRAPAALRVVYLDYVSDRLSDIALFGAVALALRDTDPTYSWVALGVLLGSLTSSYCRAQAVALRFIASTWVSRLERMVLLVGGLWASVFFPVNGMRVALVLLAGITALSFAERVAVVWRAPPLRRARSAGLMGTRPVPPGARRRSQPPRPSGDDRPR